MTELVRDQVIAVTAARFGMVQVFRSDHSDPEGDRRRGDYHAAVWAKRHGVTVDDLVVERHILSNGDLAVAYAVPEVTV